MSPGRALTISLLLHVGLVMLPIRSPTDLTAAPARTIVASGFQAAWHVPKQAPAKAAIDSPRPNEAPPPQPEKIALPMPASVLPKYYRSSEVEQRAEPIDPPPIVIPEVAYVTGVRGTLRLRIYVGPNGAVDAVDILSADPPGVYEQAALEAVTATRFEPARLFGRPVGNVKEIEIKLDPYETISKP